MEMRKNQQTAKEKAQELVDKFYEPTLRNQSRN